MQLPKQTQKVLDAALLMRKAEMSPIFIDHRTKKPLGPWLESQKTILSEGDLYNAAKKLKPKALAVVCGSISGGDDKNGLLVLDFDVPGYYEKWCKKIGVPYSKSFLTQTTGGGGKQVFLRCPDPGRNDKLAHEPKESDVSGREVAIETRGEGGYVVVPPSLHPSGGYYQWDKTCGKSVSTIKQDQAVAVLDSGRSLDRVPFTKQQQSANEKIFKDAKKKQRRNGSEEIDVIGKFNETNNIRDTLEKYGYTLYRGSRMYIRPGGDGSSVIVDDERQESFHFSTNDILNDGHRKDAFDVYLQYEHGGKIGDAVKAAARELGIKLPTRQEKQQKIIDTGSDLIEKAPFSAVGHNRGTFYYMSHKTYQITHMQASGHTRNFLLTLADLPYWEKNFSSGARKKGVDWDVAVNTLFNACYKAGIYDSGRVRGRGVWIDEDRIVQHNGGYLVVDGIKMPIKSFKSKFIYQADLSLEHEKSPPLTSSEAIKFLEACRQLSWIKSINGILFAGWCVIAIICGALKWRPHIWLTGASGTGKSWVLRNIAEPAVGPHCIRVLSNSTEAGLRQKIEQNAFPVIFDEAEGEDGNARKNIQKVVELSRQASSESGASILKGTISGKSQEYRVRSPFMFASINANIGQKADASRITVLELCRPHKKDREDIFDSIKEKVLPTITPDYCASLRARTIRNVITINKNADVFADAFAQKFGDRRAADQYGVLLAGAFSLTSSTQITPEDAAKWIDKQDWSEQSVFEAKNDEVRCLNIILEYVVEYSIGRDRIRRSVGQIITSNPIPAAGKEAIELHGIKVQKTKHPGNNDIEPENHLIISNSHSGIASILRDTPWAKSWKLVLRRLSEDLTFGKVVKIAGKSDRCTAIPFSVIFDNSGEEE